MLRLDPSDLPDDLRLRASKIRLACFDVDGVLTDGSLYVGPDGVELVKAFNVQDGLGLKLLEENGVRVALITARSHAAVAQRAFELGIRHVFQGERDKFGRVDSLCEEMDLELEQVCFVGDDLPDLAPMAAVGLAVAVANAHPWVREHAHWRTTHTGGNGAAREVADLLLVAQNKAAALLERHRRRP